MTEKGISQTALKAACYRAYHAVYDKEPLFVDSLAYEMVGKAEFDIFISEMVSGLKSAAPDVASSLGDDMAILAFMVQAMATPALTLSRGRYAEDCLAESLEKGLEQYVILGAGLDTFAFRIPGRMAKLKVFELDLPAIQEYKQQRIVQLGWEIPASLHFVRADFAHQNIAAALSASTYDPKIPALFSWMGVTYYLSRDAVLNNLASIASTAAPGSRVVFDYLDSDILIAEKSAPRAQQVVWLAQQLGEPIIGLFDPAELERDLTSVGWHLIENLGPPEIQERYFKGRSDGYYACENAHFVLAEIEKQ